MSYSTLFAVYKTKVREVAEYRNGHGSAPPIWTLLWRIECPTAKSWPMDDRSFGKLCNLAANEKVPWRQRIALAFTFDRAYVAPPDIIEVADALEAVHADIIAGTRWTWSHLPRIADDMRRVSVDKRMIGLALNATSVGDVWDDYPKGREPWSIMPWLRGEDERG